jgi:hypothetical protein
VPENSISGIRGGSGSSTDSLGIEELFFSQPKIRKMTGRRSSMCIIFMV